MTDGDLAQDRQEIRDLMARYARGIDRMDWQLVRSCYHPGARDDRGVFRGDVEELITFLASDQALPAFACTMHTMSNQNVVIDGPCADAETYCITYHRSTERQRDWGRADVTIGLRYVDELERHDGRWGIVNRVVVHEWIRRDPIVDSIDFPDSTQWGRRDMQDLSYQSRIGLDGLGMQPKVRVSRSTK